MIIRKLKDSEIDLSVQMSEYAFQYQLSEKEREERLPLIDPDTTWVAEEDGQILSKATVLPLKVYAHGKTFLMGGVSGVATWPEHRRGGLVKELLYQSLKEMRDKGQLLSFLAPFSIPFYRKFGWELFAEEQKITLTDKQLPQRKKTNGYVKRVDKDHTIIDPIYHKWAQRFNGTLVRDEEWWKRTYLRATKGYHFAVYFNESNEARGYIIFEVKSNTMTITELIWLDTNSRDGLLTFIANHDSMVNKVELTTTPHDGLPFILPDPKVERQVVSYFMGRIVDVKAYLENIPFYFTDDNPIVLHVTDDFCEWNDGTYFIYPSTAGSTPVKVECYPTSERDSGSCQHPPKRGISLSVQTLAAVLLNSQTIDVLVREGLIKGDEMTAKRLDAALSKAEKPFIADFF